MDFKDSAMNKLPRILCIVGPTASGKTGLAVELCRLFGGEVVSADSMQIYRGMDIGTAKPTRDEMGGIPHHMLDAASPFEDYSVARYVEEASRCVDDILARGRLPVVAGGTGLYIDALVGGMRFAGGPEDETLRRGLREEAALHGPQHLHDRLRALDPVSAARLHVNDVKRVIRALEVVTLTGMPISQHNEQTKSLPLRYDALFIGLSFTDRSALYARIDRRVDRMMESGLVAEAEALLRAGVSRRSTAMQAIGYREIGDYLDGACTLSEAVSLIKQHSRNYAKRQLVWFRRNDKIHWIHQPLENQPLENGPFVNGPLREACSVLLAAGFHQTGDGGD